MTIEVFIKKPEKVEVLKYDGTNYDEVVKFAGDRFHKIKNCFVKGDYIIKYDDHKIVARSDKPDCTGHDFLGQYTRNVDIGVNPYTFISLEKLQEYFEVPIMSDRKDVNNMTSNNCGVKKYQKKPIIVEAMQNTGDNVDKVMMFAKDACRTVYTPKGYVYRIMTPEGKKYANVGDYIIKGVKGEFYPCKPDVFDATYDEYTKPKNSNRTSKPSNFSLRNLVMQIAPKHIRYYIKRLEEYGFKLKYINEAEIKEESAYIPFTVLEDKNGHEVSIVDRDDCIDTIFGFDLLTPNKDGHTFDVKNFEVKNNNWREAFNKLVASFPDEIMKNTNHHANLSS